MLFLSILLIRLFITMSLIPVLRATAVRLHAEMDLPDPRKARTEHNARSSAGGRTSMLASVKWFPNFTG
jgi:hypothetical protein